MKERARRLREAAREIDRQEKELRRLIKRAEELLRDSAPDHGGVQPRTARRKPAKDSAGE